MAKPTGRPNGRPPRYNRELALAICERLAKGESLRAICRESDMPDRMTVNKWIVEDTDGFFDLYARSRDAGLDTIADEVFEIADDGSNDWMESNKPDAPGYVANGEHLARSRLRFDARRWYLSKLAPKRYGDRTVLAGDPDAPLVPAIDDRSAAAELAAILAPVLALPPPGDDDDVSDLA